MKALLIASALLLSACGSVVPTTVLKLSNLSPLTADPADFAVQVTLPDGIDVTPGTAQLTFTGQRTPDSPKTSGTFTLARAGDVFRIAPDDLQPIRDLQAQFNAWETEDADQSSGSLGVTVGACTTGAGPTPDARISVAIQIADGGPFLLLVRNAPLLDVAAQDDINALLPCP